MMRFNHMELTFEPGTLTPEVRADVDDFYGGVFGWRCVDTEILGQTAHLLLLDERATQFILLAESPRFMSSPGYDHLGLLQDTREEVDELLERVKARQASDPRIQLKTYDDLVTGETVVHAFYVRHLLPIWFDVQSIEYGANAPASDWSYG